VPHGGYTPTRHQSLTTSAPFKRSKQFKSPHLPHGKLPGAISFASSRLWCTHIARSLAQALPDTRSNYAQSKNPFRPSCPAIVYVYASTCIGVY
jgi:hypothetical protein